MDDLQKQLEALQQRCQDDHRELQHNCTGGTGVRDATRKEVASLLWHGGSAVVRLGGRSALVHSDAEVERGSSGLLPAQVPR